MLRRTAAAIAVVTTAGAIATGVVATTATAAPAAPALRLSAPNTPSDTMCGTRYNYTPFTRFGDDNPYWLVRGGDFEGSSTGWTGEQFTIVDENEPYVVGGRDDSQSAQLRGSGATLAAPGMCVRADEPTVRFFYKSPGIPGARLTVHMRTSSAAGSSYSTYTIDGSRTGWQVSEPLTITDTTDATGMQWLNLSFTTSGANTTWSIDDVYVDPWKYRTR